MGFSSFNGIIGGGFCEQYDSIKLKPYDNSRFAIAGFFNFFMHPEEEKGSME